MQFLDRTGVGTLWSMCKIKFALAYHTHDSLDAVGNEQISANAYSSGLHFKPYYNSGGPTIFGNILEYTSINTGGGQLAMEWTSSQTKNDGTDSNVGRVYYRSKRDNINGWTKWMTLAYTDDVPTKLSQLINDKGFITGSVSGNTVTINGASTTWTNTWRGIQDNLTSTSTSDSLSANQGRVLKGLIDNKANSSDLSSYSQKDKTVENIFNNILGSSLSGYKQILNIDYADGTSKNVEILNASGGLDGFMSAFDKNKLDNIAAGANNYTLPTASASTLGGIKVSNNTKGNSWPICVNNDGIANTYISGLRNNDYGDIESITIEGQSNRVHYDESGVSITYLKSDTEDSVISFPQMSGTLALKSDIPDVESLGSFHFADNINECYNGLINLLFVPASLTIDLSCLDNLGGIIIFLTKSYGANVYISHTSGPWCVGGIMRNPEYRFSITTSSTIITVRKGKVLVLI